MSNFLSLLGTPEVLKIVLTALAVGIMVSLCAAILGVCLVLKRCSMIGDGLSHVGYAALAVASALGLGSRYSMELSIPIVLAAAFILLKISSRSKMGGDAAIACFSTGAMAVGTLIFNLTGGTAGDACTSLFGSASLITISTKDMIFSLLLSTLVILVFFFMSAKIFSVTFDESFAAATGIKVKTLELILALLTAITIVVGMRLMGAILISGLVIFPPLSAMRITKSFKGTLIASAIISVTCFIPALIIACAYSLQTGPAVIVMNILVYGASTLYSKINKH